MASRMRSGGVRSPTCRSESWATRRPSWAGSRSGRVTTGRSTCVRSAGRAAAGVETPAIATAADAFRKSLRDSAISAATPIGRSPFPGRKASYRGGAFAFTCRRRCASTTASISSPLRVEGREQALRERLARVARGLVGARHRLDGGAPGEDVPLDRVALAGDVAGVVEAATLGERAERGREERGCEHARRVWQTAVAEDKRWAAPAYFPPSRLAGATPSARAIFSMVSSGGERWPRSSMET